MNILLFLLLSGNALLYWGVGLELLPQFQSGRKGFILPLVGNGIQNLLLVLYYWPVNHFLLSPGGLEFLDFPILLIGYGALRFAILSLPDRSRWVQLFFPKEQVVWGEITLSFTYIFILSYYEIGFFISLLGILFYNGGLIVGLKLILILKERYDLEPVSKKLQGMPIVLVTLFLLSSITYLFKWIAP